MLEDERLNLEESETLPATTDSNAKRAFLGILVGGIFFVGLVIGIVVLVILAGLDYKPIPPKPERRITAGNPYILTSYVVVKGGARAGLKNNRRTIENPKAMLSEDPVISNTTENYEPETLLVEFKLVDEHFFNVRYLDPDRTRWEVTENERNEDKYAEVSQRIRPYLHLQVPAISEKFGWEFYGKREEQMHIMSTDGCKLQYYDKYVEFEAKVQTHEIYGMGERVSGLRLKVENYSLWNYDASYEFGKDPTEGTFGSHPFFLNRLSSNKFIGVFMRNSNAMLFSFWNTGFNGTFINYKMVGGIIDLSIFHAAEPDYILKKYHAVIGRPYLPPVWALGFHQAREGLNLTGMKELFSNHTSHWTPIDSFWADTEMTEGGKTFTINQGSYAGVKEFAEELRKKGHHIVVMTNPGLKAEKGYKYYDMATNDDCLIKSARHFDQPLEGRTHAGKTVWLDHYLHKSQLVWAEGLNDLRQAVNMDGVWISMNEPTQMCSGECFDAEIPDPNHNETEFDYLQYRPTIQPLESNTLHMAGYHKTDSHFGKQFFTHNLFGLQVAKDTYESLSSLLEEKRFLVVSRSTFFGSGHYTSHWVDKNYATWDSLRGCISAMLNFNIFGIPHVGSPIGGFIGDVEEELLIRWYGVGAYSPLMLSYTSASSNRKDIFSINDDRIPLLREIVFDRYKLLRFFYTKIFESHIWGGPVVHPLFFEFPQDLTAASVDVVETSFMWGSSLYVIPALIKSQVTVKAYLPNWRWYNFATLELVVDHHDSDSGDFFIFDQPLGQVTVLIKGGSIVPYQSTIVHIGVMNANQLKDFPVYLIVAPDHTGRASGTMVVDAEGIKPVPQPKADTYRHYSFTYMNQIFRVNKLAGFEFKQVYETDSFWQMIILDLSGKRDVSFACYMDMNYHKRNLKFTKAAGDVGLIIAEEGHKLIPMHNFESIVWGTVDEHNFCDMDMGLTSVMVQDQGRTMIGQLKSLDMATKEIKYEMQAKLLMNNLLSFQLSIIREGAERNWVVPEVVSEEVRNTVKSTIALSHAVFAVSPLDESFHFSISDPHDSRNFMFTSKNFPITLLPNFIHLRLVANGRHVFGLGERIHKFELKDGVYSVFSFDQTAEETGVPPGNNMWGSHPFYLVHLNDPHNFAAVLFLNSNPMDVRVRHMGAHIGLDHIFTGGIVDSFYFWGGSVDELVRNYQYVVGKPAPVPYWAFGYHQCKWGYVGIDQVEYVVNRFESENIPLDGVWIDKDYMADERDFLIDRKNWLRLPIVVDELRKKDYKFVLLVDPALAIDDGYPPYVQGLAKRAYVISSFTNEPLVGVSWPGYSVYIDFVQPTALRFWEDCLRDFRNTVKFDGLWLDMNEPSNFCDGECPDGIHYQYYNFPLDFYDDLYYNPTHRALEHRTISMEALHKGEKPQPEFNYHSLYGFMQSRATAAFFIDKLKMRPLVLSSSTFPGSGRYVGHWVGDNYSNWDWMKLSLSNIFNFQLFGIPFTGADICGFNGNATATLCSRWMQLGAFYPMMRNHNSKHSRSQEPYTDEKLKSVSKKAIRTRYTLARYIYTSHMRTVLHGGLYFKPLLFDFPSDTTLYSVLEATFMFGPALKVTPVLEDRTVVMNAYFPNWDWFDLNTLKQTMKFDAAEVRGKNISLSASLLAEVMNVHVKGGSVVVQTDFMAAEQETKIVKMMEHPVELIIAPHEESAVGFAYFDNDETMDYKQGEYWEFEMKVNRTGLKVELIGGSRTWKYNKADETIAHIKLLGVEKPEEIKCVKMHNKTDGSITNLKHDYKADNKLLLISAEEGKCIRFSNIDAVLWRDIAC